MTIASLSFEKIAGHVLVSGGLLALSIGMVQAQAPASPAPTTASAPAPARSALTIHLTGFRNARGRVYINLFRDAKGFPSDRTSAVESQILEIDPKTLTATAVFASVPQGAYAVSVLHDENLTGKLDYDSSGIPQEGYGISNNPDTTQGPPTAESATFAVNQAETKIEIKLVYRQ